MKRFLKGLSLAGLAALVLTLSACDLTELNENPNEPADVTTGTLLANAQNYLATTYWDDYPAGFWVRYAQYWTTNQYTESDRYDYPAQRASSNSNNWSRFYLALNDLEEIKRISRQTPDEVAPLGPAANQIAIAKIMQAFTWQMMVDMWGPIPFEDALQGRSGAVPDSVKFTPSYSTQQTIYHGLLEMLTEASDSIQTGSSTLASNDLVYGGDMANWKKLANALKMRVAIRMADVDSDAASAAINEAITAGAFEGNADNAAIPFSGSPPYQNPFYDNYEVQGRDDWAAPEPILGLMNATGDPRRSAYFTESSPGEFNPFPYGVPPSQAQSLFQSESFSRPSGLVRSDPAAPAFIMFYDEVLFIQAEAVERGYISGDAASLYEQAITASMDRWGVSGADAYIANVPYNNSNGWVSTGGVGATWEQTIGTQKWLALYMQGMQGWSEWRRLDLQEVLQVPAENPGQDMFGCNFPLRMVYPNAEFAVNEASLIEAVGTLNDESSASDGDEGDTQGNALWWDIETPSCN